MSTACWVCCFGRASCERVERRGEHRSGRAADGFCAGTRHRCVARPSTHAGAHRGGPSDVTSTATRCRCCGRSDRSWRIGSWRRRSHCGRGRAPGCAVVRRAVADRWVRNGPIRSPARRQRRARIDASPGGNRSRRAAGRLGRASCAPCTQRGCFDPQRLLRRCSRRTAGGGTCRRPLGPPCAERRSTRSRSPTRRFPTRSCRDPSLFGDLVAWRAGRVISGRDAVAGCSNGSCHPSSGVRNTGPRSRRCRGPASRR